MPPRRLKPKVNRIPLGRGPKSRIAQKVAIGIVAAAVAAGSLLLWRRHLPKNPKPKQPTAVKNPAPKTMPSTRLVPRRRK